VVFEPNGNVDVIVGTSDRSRMEVDRPPAEQPVIDTATGKELVRLGDGRKLIPLGWRHVRDG
jgi:hypothetical protein